MSTLVKVPCPHCGKRFDYPAPTEIPPDQDYIIKATTCPICDKPINIRFPTKRTTTVYRDGKAIEERVLDLSAVQAEKRD